MGDHARGVDGRDPPSEKALRVHPALADRGIRSPGAMAALLVVATLAACAPRPPHPPPGPDSGASRSRKEAPKVVKVSPLPGWPRWLGETNLQISGLGFRDGHLYAVGDQSGAETRALLEIALPPGDDASAPGAAGLPPADAAAGRSLEVRVRCRWQDGPHPDAEAMALDPSSGPPRSVLLSLESRADALLEVDFDDCALRGQVAPLTGSDSNEGIEGIALSPDERTVYLVHETHATLLTMPRGGPGPAREIARIEGARSLCDAAYDDRGTPATDDDRLLLLDRNARRILDVTLDGRAAGVWDLDPDVARDPDGFPYSIVALEALALEAREADGSLLVYAATDTPPRPFPYSRRGKDDDAGRYERRVGMLYRYRLPPFP